MSGLKEKILGAVKDELLTIEKELEKNLDPYLDLVREIAGHLLFSGGKRLRPLLMVLSARLCEYDDEFGFKFSCIFEYLHAATLLHDDVIDGAGMRRGKLVANSIYGNAMTVLTGDFLLAKALSIAAESGNIKVMKIIGDITGDMAQGEIHQLSKVGDVTLTENEYMQVIRNKTAVLFMGACRLSAVLADAGEEAEKALADYGHNLGIAFQMADDLLDYTADVETLGKNPGADLREGKLTLPVIYSLANADEKDRLLMEKIIKNKEFSANDFKILLNLLNNYGGISYTSNLALEYVQKAKESLKCFGRSETLDILYLIADYASERKG